MPHLKHSERVSSSSSSPSLSSSSAFTMPKRPAPIQAVTRVLSSGSARSIDSAFSQVTTSPSNGRPTLLPRGYDITVLPHDDDDDNDLQLHKNRLSCTSSVLAPPRPRRLWKVSDTGLRSLPLFAPPLDPHCCCHVSDAPPSVVAVRIAECLVKRSVAVEYDEEQAVAYAMTVDRCYFTISLWDNSNTSSSNNNSPSLRTTTSRSAGAGAAPATPFVRGGLIVECMRTSGSVLTFHRTVRAVLAAALSHSAGRDTRSCVTPHLSSPLEFARMKRPASHMQQDQQQQSRLLPPAKRATVLSTAALEDLERALQLLRKDRLDTQRLGMESLVALTDAHCSGTEKALYTALAVLGAPIMTGLQEDVICLGELHRDWILAVLTNRKLPNELSDQALAQEINESFACAASLLGEDSLVWANWHPSYSSTTNQATMAATTTTRGDLHHGSIMRALVLRAFCNSLSVLAEKQPKILESLLELQSPQLVSKSLLQALVDDVHGGSQRPHSASAGTRLASVHEAALAAKCLGLLGSHNDNAKKVLVDEMDVLTVLEQARAVGKSTHVILAEEARNAHLLLTESEREC